MTTKPDARLPKLHSEDGGVTEKEREKKESFFFFTHIFHRFRTRVRVFWAFSSARLKNEKKKRAFGKNEKKNARLKNEKKKKRAFEKVEASCLRGEVFRTRVEKVVFSNARPVFQTRVRKNHFFERAFEKKKKKRPFFFTRVRLFERAFFFFFHVRVFQFWICAFSIFERAFETYDFFFFFFFFFFCVK